MPSPDAGSMKLSMQKAFPSPRTEQVDQLCTDMADALHSTFTDFIKFSKLIFDKKGKDSHGSDLYKFSKITLVGDVSKTFDLGTTFLDYYKKVILHGKRTPVDAHPVLATLEFIQAQGEAMQSALVHALGLSTTHVATTITITYTLSDLTDSILTGTSTGGFYPGFLGPAMSTKQRLNFTGTDGNPLPDDQITIVRDSEGVIIDMYVTDPKKLGVTTPAVSTFSKVTNAGLPSILNEFTSITKVTIPAGIMT